MRCTNGGGQSRLFNRQNYAGYVLKADIRHYFDTVDKEILIKIVARKISDPRIIWLIRLILENHNSGISGKGMPIGNLTSQFFANVYLNELDHFIKHRLRARYYIRYVDDFILLHRDKQVLLLWKDEINSFLKSSLRLELHPEKTHIARIEDGITMLGYRIFYSHRLIKRSNARRIWKRLSKLKRLHSKGEMSAEQAGLSLAGWIAYAEFADTYNFRNNVASHFNTLFK